MEVGRSFCIANSGNIADTAKIARIAPNFVGSRLGAFAEYEIRLTDSNW
jgi:hypothetical protein